MCARYTLWRLSLEKTMQQSIIVLNSGSSSLKFAIYTITENIEKLPKPQAVYRGEISGLDSIAKLRIKNAEDVIIAEQSNLEIIEGNKQQAALNCLLQWINKNLSEYKLVVAGHRVVHGGTKFIQPVIIDDTVMQILESYNVLAPQHQPYNIAGIQALAKAFPEVLQVACFDTMFHTTQSEVAQAFALPQELSPQPIKRYGFHGLSYEYIAHVLPDYLGESEANNKTIVAHLGHGASLCAIQHRRSIATTMGFTALDGLMMATRCGSLDPGVILYMLEQLKMSPLAISQLLYKQSGLLGVSGISSDTRDLLQSSQPQAKKAIDLFVYRIIKEIGGLVAVMGGLNHLIFTAGIGEHSPQIRQLICQQFDWLGLELDLLTNNSNNKQISTGSSAISVWVIPTNEEMMIAQHALQFWRSSF
jgi:acetate kinase